MKDIYFIGMIGENSSFEIYFLNLYREFKKNKQINVIDKTYKYDNKTSKIKILFTYMKYILKLREIKKGCVIEITNANIFPPITLNKNSYKIHICHDFFSYDKDFNSNKKGFSKVLDIYYRYIHRYLYKYVFNKANKIIAISNATKNEIISKFGKKYENKINIIYNGLDVQNFVPIKNHKKKEEYILYIGSELKRKNLKGIIEAFSIVKKEYPNLKLFKAPGEKVDICRENTLKYISNNNLTIGEDVVLFDDYLTQEKIIELYQNALVFVFPSLKEGFGFPIIEAQACGTPVITSNYEPMSELVEYKDMLVDPLNPRDIANKIMQILKSPALKNRMINEGLENSKRFSREKSANEFYKLLSLG